MKASLMIHDITIEQVTSVRALLCEAIDARITWEKSNPAQRSLESKLSYLVTFRNRCARVDAFALGYLHANPIAFNATFLSHRRSNEAFNIYAMPKVLEVARCLNGGAFTANAGGDHMTLAGTIIALHDGITLESAIAHALNMFANNVCNRASYNSGATQASSSLRALEALGIVRKTGKVSNCQMWGIADAERFERLHEAAQGISHESVTADEERSALAAMSDSTSKRGRAASRRVTPASAPASVASAPVPATPAKAASSLILPYSAPAAPATLILPDSASLTTATLILPDAF